MSTSQPKPQTQSRVHETAEGPEFMIGDQWSVRSMMELVELPAGQVDPRREPYNSWTLVAPDHMESGTGRLLQRETAKSQNAISGKYLFSPGDVLYSKIRPYLRKAVLANFEGLCSADVYPLRPRQDVHPSFLLALILSESFSAFAESVSMRSGFPKINRAELAEYRSVIPPFSEQARIAEVLDTLDKAIRGTQTQIEKNSLIYQGLQELFFAPHAIQTREEWQEIRLEDIAESITSGPRGWACYYAEEGDHFLRIGNLTRKHLDLRFDDVVKVQPPAGAEGVRTALTPGDLLISITADLGIIGVVPDWMGVAYINQHIARARVIRSKANPRFLGYQLAGQLGQKQFYRLNDVGAKAGLNLPTVGRLKVWLPSLPVQNQIATALDTVQQSLRQDEALLMKLAGLKSGLTTDLLTGKVRTS